MGKPLQSIPEAMPLPDSGTPGKFVYLGERAKYGPYRGFTPEGVADGLGITEEDARKDFLDNLKAW